MTREEILNGLDLKEMMDKSYEVLNFCNIYDPREVGMKAIEEEWLKAKLYTDVWNGKSLFEILASHPNYVKEKGYVVFSNEYERPIDKAVFNDVMIKMCNMGYEMLKEVKLGAFTYKEARNCKRRLGDVLEFARDFDSVVDKAKVNAVREDWLRFMKIVDNYEMRDNTYIVDRKAYDSEEWNKADRFEKLMYHIKEHVLEGDKFSSEMFVDENILERIMKVCPDIKGIRVGHKLNRVIGKIIRHFGYDTHENANQYLARLGDAISPIKFTRHTIFSLNRVDYWTMSWGDNWCSCANIDKEHYRESSDLGMYGDGCCSSGTESYMLDPSTVVVYTVDSSYNGKDFEMQDKLNRCLFHVGEGKFVMGRVYPQGTDGEDAVYKQWRQNFQEVLATCMNITNYWATKREDKSYQYYSNGTHYRDYEMAYCNVAGWSYHKPNADSKPSAYRILIGHNPICPRCGDEHEEESNIQCCGIPRECYGCGCHEREDNMHLIDGDWYCEDCCFYCDSCGEWETGDRYETADGDTVCEYALENYYAHCDNCNEYHLDDDFIRTDDGYWYCCEECAEEAGYVFDEETEMWIKKEEN